MNTCYKILKLGHGPMFSPYINHLYKLLCSLHEDTGKRGSSPGLFGFKYIQRSDSVLQNSFDRLLHYVPASGSVP